MSTAQVQRTKNVSKLYSGVSRFDEPEGSVPRGSNMIWLRRGALRTTDGSLMWSSLNGGGPTTGQNPFRWIGRYFPTTATQQVLYALQTGGGQIKLIDVTNPVYAGALQTYTSSYVTPSFVQAQDTLAIALGFDVLPQLFKGGTSAAITNSWQGAGKLPTWTANSLITVNTAIVPTAPNGHVYICVVGGTTGGSQPSFPTTINARVQDGSVMWQEAGPSVPPTPLGATSLFYHGGFLFAWGTSATYNADGLNGPDTLWQSDQQNFNSWNPLNMTFVGKGDGTIARGGGVLTLSEAGIAATAQLVLFKDVDTYVFNGFFPSWSLNKAPSGVGCVAPGTVRFLAGLGLIRLCYRGVALFDGQDDIVDQYTDPIREYLFGSDEKGIIQVDWQNINLAMGAQVDNPKMYLLAVPLVGGGGQLTRIFAYDVALSAWATPIDLPFGISALAYVPENNITYRTFFGTFNDGTIQNFGNNASSTWNGTPISWAVRTPEIGEPETPSFIRRLNVRGQAVFSSQPYLTNAILNYQTREGLVLTRPLLVNGSTKVLTESLDVGLTCLSANVDLTGVDRAIVEGLGYQYTPKSPSQIGGALYSSISKVANVTYQQGATQTVGANVFSVIVTLPVAAPSANYLVNVTPNWNTTIDVVSKVAAQFTVAFNTPSPPDGSGSFDWIAQVLS